MLRVSADVHGMNSDKGPTMKNMKLTVALLAAVAMLASTLAVRAQDDKKDEKKPCCEATVEAGKKCEHKCCVKAAEDGKVCEKCHPKKKEEKKD